MMKNCPFGFYCPNPKTSNLFDACPLGTYRKANTGTVLADCTKCDGGYGCVEPGGADKYTKCGAGYYCNSASPTTTPLYYCSTTTGGITSPNYDPVTFTCTS